MKLSGREAVLLVATVTVALFGVSYMLARPKVREWKELRRQQTDIRLAISRDRRLIDDRPTWESRYEEASKELQQHPPDKKMDVHWLSLMDRIASRHRVRITKRQVGEEKQMGDMYELPIEVRDWQGSLEGLVHFLFDLENEGGMLDVRQLFIKPLQESELRGRFLLYCAYTRGSAGGAPNTDNDTE